MANRPFQSEKIDFFEAYERNNSYSPDALQQLLNELKYRKTGTYPRYGALKARVENRLASLKEIHTLLAGNFQSQVFTRWFLGAGEKHAIFDSTVTTGSIPLPESDFDALLMKHQITPCYMGTDLDILIVGRVDWNAEELMQQIDLRINKQLKVYSQEMVLAYLGCGKDPFGNREILEYFGFGHPALEFLTNLGFDWPFTHAIPGVQPLPEVNWPKQGLLSYIGYAVGKNGKPLQKRRQLLREVFEAEELPKVNSQRYMDQWGETRSGTRLYKLAHSLAAFARNAKRKYPEGLALAIKHWESDLKWLEDNFYTGRFRFSWPSTFVGHEYRKKS